jgi:D-apionolactonase
MTTHTDFISSLDRETMWHGDHFENDRRIVLKAGCLSMIYENGSLRNISDGRNELIRMIYSAVRDPHWLTVNPEITGEIIEVLSDSFSIEYKCIYKAGAISFSALYKIEGRADNTISFSMEGKALGAFEKNRIGFCLLHPVEGCAGEECIITHSSGDDETMQFPLFITPHQPFRDIKSMRWKINSTVCLADFYGDVFETEDQRNWTDASFKTYCTPLEQPFPVKIAKGTMIKQRIEIKAEHCLPDDNMSDSFAVIKLDTERLLDLPVFGIGRSSRSEPLTEKEAGIIRQISFNHYRVEFFLFSPEWKINAGIALNEASLLNYSLELVLFFGGNIFKETDEIIDWLTENKPEIFSITLFNKTAHTTSIQLQEEIAPLFRRTFPGVKIAFGTNANFAQLNRNKTVSVYNDLLSYSIHPQEHASDNATLVENLQAQASTVESAKHFAGEKEIWISPVNIQRRFNANIQNFDAPQFSNMFPAQADSRIMSIFGASWTAGSIKYLSESGVKGITFFETAGERGIIQGENDSRWPEDFKAVKGMIFPVFHLFKFLLSDRKFKLIMSSSSRPLSVNCLALSDSNRIKLVIMNFTSIDQTVLINGFTGNIEIRRMNSLSYANASEHVEWLFSESGFQLSVGGRLRMEPYSLCFVEGSQDMPFAGPV